jgi:hypothetical protein
MMKLTRETIEMMSPQLVKPSVQVLSEPIPEDEMFEEEAISTIFDRVEKEYKFSKSQFFQAKEPNPLLMYLYSMDVNSIANAVLIPVFGLCLVALVVFPGPKPSEKTARVLPSAELGVPVTPRYSFPKVEKGVDLPSGLIDFSKMPK